MGKKCKCPPAGAPEWMVTYGDMVTLLLCFFVLIVSFSEIKKKEEFQSVVEEIQKAFGMRGGGGKLPTEDDPALSLIERLEAVRMRQERIPNKSNVKDPGQTGREPRVTTIREGNDRGYRCVAIGDACASYFPEFHRVGLEMIKAQGGIFGWVSDAASLAATLKSAAKAA